MPLQPSQLPIETPNKWECSLAALRLQTPPRMRTDGDMRYVCIQHDVFSGKPSSLTEAHPSVAYECHQPTRFIISCLATLLNDSQLIHWDRLSCRCIPSVRHERATEGIASFYAMLTHSEVDDGTHGGKDTFYRVDVHALLKAPVSELSSL